MGCVRWGALKRPDMISGTSEPNAHVRIMGQGCRLQCSFGRWYKDVGGVKATDVSGDL